MKAKEIDPNLALLSFFLTFFGWCSSSMSGKDGKKGEMRQRRLPYEGFIQHSQIHVCTPPPQFSYPTHRNPTSPIPSAHPTPHNPHTPHPSAAHNPILTSHTPTPPHPGPPHTSHHDRKSTVKGERKRARFE